MRKEYKIYIQYQHLARPEVMIIFVCVNLMNQQLYSMALRKCVQEAFFIANVSKLTLTSPSLQLALQAGRNGNRTVFHGL